MCRIYRIITMKMSFCSICKYCFLIVILIYGTFHVFFELVQTFLPFGMMFVGLFSLGLYVIRVPPPDNKIVESIIGKLITEEMESNGDYLMKSIAHRGAGLDAPENSLEAFNTCHKKGCTAIEFDVKLTSDHIPVIFHDETLERMADSELHINKNRWENLCKIDISVKHPFKDKFANTTIPTLEQTVELLLKNGQRMFIDIKDNDGKIIKVILDLYEKYPELHCKAVVSSFFPNIIYYIRRSNPKIVCSLAWRPHCFAYTSYSALGGLGEKRSSNILKHFFLVCCDNLHEWLLSRFTYNILGLSLILLHKDVISPKVVTDWHDKGVRVVAWTVNHPVDKQYFARTLKVTYITDTLTGENSVHSLAN